MRGHFRTHHVIQEQVSIVRMLRAGGNHQGIHAEAHALLGIDRHQIGVLHLADNGEIGEQIRRGNLAGEQVLIRRVVIQGAYVGLQLHELIGGLLQLRVVGGVIGIAQHLQGFADHHPRVVQQAQAVGKLRIPQIREIADFSLHPVGVVHDHGRTHGVGNGIHVVRVEILVEIIGVQVAEIGQLVLVQGHQQVLFAGAGDDVIAGHDDVVILAAALLQLQKHFLIGGKGDKFHLDAVFLREARDGIRVHIIFPGIDAQHLFLFRKGAAAAHAQGEGQQNNQKSFHESGNLLHSSFFISPGSFFRERSLLRATAMATVASMTLHRAFTCRLTPVFTEE